MAVEEIKQQIFSGKLPADANHFESELAERLGMSRTPIREATLVLEAQRLLEVVPRKGVRRVRLVTLNLRPLPTQSNEDHRRLYEAIANGDSSSAHKIHRKHRQQTSKMLIEILNQSGFKRL